MSVTTPARNWTLRSGERQVAPRAAEIRADHRARYEWAASLIPEGAICGLDAFCGVGYGTELLAQRVQGFVVGVDGSPDAIAYAEAHYASARAIYSCKQWPFGVPRNVFDFVACFESAEHVEDGRALLAALTQSLKPGGILFLSTPNETRMPRAAFKNDFHVRHYTREEILSMAGDMEVIEWYGQLVDERDKGVLRAAEAEADYLCFAFRRIR